MAETLTANYGWTKPDPGASANTWGSTLNATTDKIDAQVYANQQRGVEIGSGALWFTNTPPTNWLICDGSSQSTATYPALFAVIGYTYGGSGANFNLPPLANVFPMGAGTLAATGGEATHLLTAAEMPTHTHAVTDPTHAHPVYDPTHTHPLYDPTHAHGASQDAHTHGGVGVGISGPGTGAIAGAVGGGGLQMGNSGGASANGVYVAAAGTGIQVEGAATGVQTYAEPTGVSIQNAGGGAAHNNLPPYLQINFIIKFQ